MLDILPHVADRDDRTSVLSEELMNEVQCYVLVFALICLFNASSIEMPIQTHAVQTLPQYCRMNSYSTNLAASCDRRSSVAHHSQQ